MGKGKEQILNYQLTSIVQLQQQQLVSLLFKFFLKIKISLHKLFGGLRIWCKMFVKGFEIGIF